MSIMGIREMEVGAVEDPGSMIVNVVSFVRWRGDE